MHKGLLIEGVTIAYHHVVRGRGFGDRVYKEFEDTPHGKYEAEQEARRKTDAHEPPDFIYYPDTLVVGERYRDQHGRRRVHKHVRTKNPVSGLLK